MYGKSGVVCKQVYILYRTVGSMLFDFLNWVEKEKKKSLINIGLKDTNRLIEEYRNCTLNENSTIINNVYNYKLSEQEKRIIDFYRNGTNVQREYINKLIINE